MSNLEQHEAWSEIVRLKDKLSLKELASRFHTTPGAISAAFKRTGTVRSPPARGEEELPPEPGEELGAMLPEVAAAVRRIRHGSKDSMIAHHALALGQLPDAEVARRAGVSVRTVASFRARHGIPGYRGPRRATQRARRGSERPEPTGREREEREVTREEPRPAGIDIVARGRTTKAARTPDAGRTTRRAWRVRWRLDDEEQEAVLLALDLVDAADLAQRAVPGAEVVGLELVGTLLEM